MEYCTVSMTKKAYLEMLKCKMDSPFFFTQERMTGLFFGPFFAITHHAEWEWNRRITSECNRAYGFVQEVNGETKVVFIRGKGLLSPFWLIFYTLLCMVIFRMAGIEPDGKIWGIAFLCALVPCGITAIQACLTENGIAGAGEITKLLMNPRDYYC